MNDNREQHELFWEQRMYNYQDLKEEITEKVTNHTNKLIDNIENKFRQINENIERGQEEAIEIVFDKLERTLDNINRQNNLRPENGNSNNDRNSNNNNNIQNTNIQNNRQQENRNRRSNSITTEERETTVTEPPLPFYKQLTSMSIHEQLTSDLFGNQQNIADEIDISDSEDRVSRIGNLLPPSVNQKVRRKYQNPTQ